MPTPPKFSLTLTTVVLSAAALLAAARSIQAHGLPVLLPDPNLVQGPLGGVGVVTLVTPSGQLDGLGDTILATGELSQALATVPGTRYALSFAVRGETVPVAHGGQLVSGGVRGFTVTVTDGATATGTPLFQLSQTDLTVTITDVYTSFGLAGDLTFKAASGQSRLDFSSVSYGEVALKNVRVVPVTTKQAGLVRSGLTLAALGLALAGVGAVAGAISGRRAGRE